MTDVLQRRYVVQRLNWHQKNGQFLRLAGALPVATFDTPEEAEAERARRERAAREVVNPFAIGSAPHEQTSLPVFALRDWLLDADLSPPPADAPGAAWRAWWASQAPTWSAEQRERVWDRLDRLQFYVVEERPAGRRVYLVVDADCHYFDYWFNGVHRAFLERQSAQEEADRLNAEEGWEEFEAREVPEGDPFTSPRDCCEFEPRPRLDSGSTGLPHNEVFELETDGKPTGTLYLVVRNIWLHGTRSYGRNPMEGGPAWAFVRGFASRSAADSYCDQQEAHARQILPPGLVECSLKKGFAKKVGRLGLPQPTGLETLEDEELQAALLDWWASLHGTATPEQRASVWALLKCEPFFDLVMVPVGAQQE
jgi:hypothetical protein